MVNLCIVSGFLGAGKTTFANKLLEHFINTGQKPVYIANELGQAVLDAKVIESKGFNAIEMEGGCICCTLKDDVSVAVNEVIDTFSPDVIVFEPSGVFVFDNFIEIVKAPPLQGKCTVSNVFTIVDGVNFNASKAVFGSFIYNQIRNAPVILISKLEKTKKDADEIICDLKNINPGGFISAEPWDSLGSQQLSDLLENRPMKLPNVPGKHKHTFKTLTISAPRDFSASDIDTIFAKQKAGGWGDTYRIKGILNVDGALMLLNIALHDMNLVPHKGYGEASVTFIGNSIDTEAVEGFF